MAPGCTPGATACLIGRLSRRPPPTPTPPAASQACGPQRSAHTAVRACRTCAPIARTAFRREVVKHGLQHLRGVALPLLQFGDDARRVAGPVGLRGCWGMGCWSRSGRPSWSRVALHGPVTGTAPVLLQGQAALAAGEWEAHAVLRIGIGPAASPGEKPKPAEQAIPGSFSHKLLRQQELCQRRWS